MNLLDNAHTDQIEEIMAAIYDAATDLNNNSEYVGSFGTGDAQKVDYVMNEIPEDFDYQHVYGTVYGLLLAVSLGNASRAGEYAQEITDMIEEATS